ncbi:hypothetical protein DDE19_33650 [Micromonospora ureilytica]|uniref:Uncharacterized protein n=1 Tax=Micromonospora ureilytica TaxID=709868 RepID=A0A3N9XRN8_9ACTN|nr:hypothetical protein [Micromonospora ureilytica]RQX09427.1 hypothetical protein DDE19_33650 [Micromonospora ureilytica]
MNQIWPVLLVAALGVTGTLGAAISTQFLTTRREDRRWNVEREREQERWEREREDRAREWQREDELRHRESREETYKEFMQTIWNWGRRAADIRQMIESREGHLFIVDTDELYEASVNAIGIMAELELSASAPVRDSARECCDVMSRFVSEVDAVLPMSEGADGLDVPVRLHDSYKAVARKTVELMRADRGLMSLAAINPQMLPNARPGSPAPFGQDVDRAERFQLGGLGKARASSQA